MSSGATAQDSVWKSEEQKEETQYIRQKEETQLAVLQDRMNEGSQEENMTKSEMDRNFEGGFGGQEDLEDRYATTCGEH